jgi:hypothetical protein
MNKLAAITVVVVGLTGVFAAQDAPKWEIQQIKDPLLGTEVTQYRLEGKYLAAPRDQDAVPAMMLRCKADRHGKFDGKLLSAFLYVGKTIVDSQISYDYSSKVTTQYRLDDGKVHTNYYGHTRDYKMISLQPQFCGECTINDFFYGHEIAHKENSSPQIKKVVLSIPEYLGSNIVIQFDLPDVTEVAKTCGITHK